MLHSRCVSGGIVRAVKHKLTFSRKSALVVCKEGGDGMRRCSAKGHQTRSFVGFGSLILALALAFLGELTSSAWGQDVPFNPRYDGVQPQKSKRRSATSIAATPTPVPIYSFKRYEPEISQICNLLGRDGRRDRIRELSELQDTKRDGCVSCRFWVRQVLYSCRSIVVKKGRASTATGPVQNTSEASSIPEAQALPARYPSTELIDQLSAFGTMLYERDAGEGPIFVAIKSWVDGLVNNPNLTPGERGYFEIFREFLLGAWQNRPEHALEPSPIPKAKIQELFE